MEDRKKAAIDLMEREQVPVTPETLRQCARQLFDGIARIYYYILMRNSIIVDSCIQEKNKSVLDEPENVERALQIFADFDKGLNNLKLNTKLIYKTGCWVDLPGSPNYAEYTKAQNNTHNVLKCAIEFVSKAIEIERFEDKPDKDYYRILVSNMKKMNDINRQAFPYVKEWEVFNEDLVTIFETGMKDFNVSVTNLKAFVNDWKSEQQKAYQPVEQERRVVVQERSMKEESRLRAIDRANSLYDELCMDFMRDLQAQYSLSSRDMYEEFVNVKFKKFVERYPMPIASDASEGYANEVAYQIQNLMDYVSKISENSYVTSVYGQN